MNINTRVNFSSTLGATFAWYDFTIFNIAVALIFPQLFFTGMAFLIPVLVFAVGTLARPFGSLIFGFMGDRLGRKTAMIATLYLTGASTVAIGLLPTQADVGIAATIALVILRITQTIAVGGEWAAASTMIVEHNADSSRRGFLASFVTSSFAIANILAALVFMAVTQFGEEFFATIGWRIPFLLSAFMLVIGVYVRHKVLETPAFESARKQGHLTNNPVSTVFRDHIKPVLVGAIAITVGPAWLYTLITVGSKYMLTHDLITRADLAQQQFAAWWTILVILIVTGWAVDKIKHHYRMFVASALASIILMIPIVHFIANGQMFWALVAVGCIMAPAMMTAPYLFCLMFPTAIRQTASGWTYGLGLAFAGVLSVPSQKIVSMFGDIQSLLLIFLPISVLALLTSRILLKQHSK